MSKILTAEEFASGICSKTNPKHELITKALKEFAKLHVKAALEAAGKVANDWENSGTLEPEILNAYPDENIK